MLASVEVDSGASLYVAPTGRLRLAPTTVAITSKTQALPDAWQFKLDIPSALFNFSTLNPDKLTLTCSKVTLGTQFIRASVIDINPVIVHLWVLATRITGVLNEFEVLVYAPNGVGVNVAGSIGIEITDG